MTVLTSTNSVVYRGNGSATQFAVPFKVLDEDHLRVRRRVYTTGVMEYTYVGTDYSYTGLGAESGTLTLAGTALSDTYELVIERIVPYTQNLDIVNAGGFYPETVEEQLDLMTMGIQQIAELAERGIVVPIGETGVELPAAEDRAGGFLGFDAEGDVAVLSGTGADSAFRTDAAASGGAALLGFIQSGTGADAESVQTALRRFVWAEQYGFSTAASAANNATALRQAVDALGATGGIVRIGPGTFNVNETNLGTVGNLIIEGAGMDATILKQPADLVSINGTLFVDSGAAGSTVNNLTFRNFTLQCDLGTFLESYHLLSLNGVRNVLVEYMKFKGSRGDAIYLGSGLNTPGATERHNYNVTIRCCVFDGVNRENRQAITVVDGDVVNIQLCHISNYTKSTMPGAIDIEPDAQAYHVTRRITVEDCYITGCGGNIGQIAVIIPAVCPPPRTIRILNNVIEAIVVGAGPNVIVLDTFRTASATDPDCDILIQGNTARNGAGIMSIKGTKGVRVIDNQFEDFTGSLVAGFNGADDVVRNVLIEKNRLIRCGTTAQAVLISESVDVTLRQNIFDASGLNTAAGCAIKFHAGVTSDRITFESNEIINPPASQTAAIIDSGQTFTAVNNLMSNNRWAGLTVTFPHANARGRAVLSAGVISLPNAGITAGSNIKAQRQIIGGTPGVYYEITRSAGVSFTITSKDAAGATQAADTSTLYYEIEAAP